MPTFRDFRKAKERFNARHLEFMEGKANPTIGIRDIITFGKECEKNLNLKFYLQEKLGKRRNMQALQYVLYMLLSAAKRSGPQDALTWLSRDKVADSLAAYEVQASGRSVSNYLKTLVEAGLIHVVSEAAFKHSCTVYAIDPMLLKVLESDYQWVGCTEAQAKQNKKIAEKRADFERFEQDAEFVQNVLASLPKKHIYTPFTRFKGMLGGKVRLMKRHRSLAA
jgi:hypothetical protein